MAEEECEEEGVSTLAEYIERVEAEELEADLVLGGDDGKECTYKQGYLKRQAVFSCLTCTPQGDAGFCTACSLACHDGHEVVELWTRRHFRCDCGNSKYGQGICKLQADKDISNAENVYNQNYRGVYCTCHRPYPDPEGADLGEMLQCVVCEDWFHELHLGLPPSLQLPRDEDGEPAFDELVCSSCVPKCLFLSKYPDLIVAPAMVETNEIVDHTNGSGIGNDNSSPLEAENNGIVESVAKEEGEAKQEVNGSTFHEAVANEDEHCELGKDSAAIINPGHPLFLTKSWRSKLCRCPRCLKMYEDKGVAFLLVSDDTLQAYEASAKRKREETRAQVEGSDLMQGLGHVQQIELLHGFNDMSDQLKNFLAPFGESRRTVTRADIQGFFAELNQKKRRHN